MCPEITDRNITPEKCHIGLNTQKQQIDRNMNSYIEVMTPRLKTKENETNVSQKN